MDQDEEAKKFTDMTMDDKKREYLKQLASISGNADLQPLLAERVTGIGPVGRILSWRHDVRMGEWIRDDGAIISDKRIPDDIRFFALEYIANGGIQIRKRIGVYAKKQTYVECDECGVECPQGGDTREGATYEAMRAGWAVDNDGRDWCQRCLLEANGPMLKSSFESLTKAGEQWTDTLDTTEIFMGPDAPRKLYTDIDGKPVNPFPSIPVNRGAMESYWDDIRKHDE